MVVTLVHHLADPVVAEMSMWDLRLADQSVDAVTSDLLTNSLAEIEVVTSVHLPMDPDVDGVNKQDLRLVVPVDDPTGDLAISDLLANVLAEIVVQKQGLHPAAPIVDVVIKRVHRAVNQKNRIAVDQVVIANRDPNDLFDETLKDRTC